jgi:hypothetical protein
LCGEIFETVPEAAVVLQRDAEFLGSCIIGLPRRLHRLLPVPDGLDEFADPVIHQTRGRRGQPVVP